MRRIIALSLAAAMLLCTGCNPARDAEISRLLAEAEGIDVDAESYTWVAVEEDFIPPTYVPEEDKCGDMSEVITGEFGQETDKLIPSVFLSVEAPENIHREKYSACTIQLDCSMTEGYESTQVLSGKIRGRGHSTWSWPKKPYKIKLEEAASLLGLDAAKEWVLIANYSDESLLRNTAAFEMARSLDSFSFVPHAIPVNVYMNGVYQGVYTLGEQLEVKESRLNIGEDLEDPDTGYLLEIGGADPETDAEGINYFDLPSGCGIDVLIKSPNTEKWTEEHFDYIYDYVCKADKAITELGDYEKYIDVDSFIDWFIVHEMTYNADSCFRRSCYLTKTAGGKLQMGPVWDFDLAFGNMYLDNPNYDEWATIGSTNSDSYIGVTWFNYLMEDKSFRSKARKRWDEVKDKLLEDTKTLLHDQRELVKSSAADNFKVWNTLEIANGYQPSGMSSYTTYGQQVQYVIRFLDKRYAWIDENL